MYLDFTSTELPFTASIGTWKVKLPAESNPGPFVIQIRSSEGSLSLTDVLFGDVWMCSGQSNMQFKMSEVMILSVFKCESLNSYPSIIFCC